MKKELTIVMVLVMMLGLFTTVSATNNYSYNKVQQVFDWGTGTTKVIVDLDKTINAGSVDWTTFQVFVKRTDSRLEESLLNDGQRRVTDTYVSDEEGNRVGKGNYVAIEMEVSPTESIGSALNYVPGGGGNDWVEAEYNIKQVKDIVSVEEKVTGINATELNKTYRPQIDKFTTGSEFYSDEDNGNIILTYAAYKPKVTESDKSPLIIWLHGGGEGGTDPTIPLAANKSVNFAAKEVQDIFGGAHVLVPQTPGKWMEASANEDEYDIEHKLDGHNSALPYTSKYTKSLMNLINKYVQVNPGVDRDRIYIGGCSNGGFMTVRMILSYPDYFAAAFPVCQGMTYSYLSDADIEILKNQNIWFVSAATDATLPAPRYTIAIYDRLIKEGAENVHLSYPARIIDRSGRYRDKNGNPHEYNGHWSWIYVYNNAATAKIDGKEVSILNWMAYQKRDKER
ncbi:MAG: peptidase [Firmicutes bacterium]|nr:peptidase [Bacillota bacterium]